jgi:ABC-type phosphate transport system substrate-binding protein
MRLRTIAAAILVGVLFVPAAWAADYALVINKSNPVSFISAQNAKSIFLGKKTTWENGVKIVVFTQSGSPVHSAFIKGVVGKTPQQFSTFWKKALFSGMGIPPKNLSSDAQVLKSVAAQPGAISYISASTPSDSVKQLEIR